MTPQQTSKHGPVHRRSARGLEDAVVVVTGGAHGLGRAYVERFVEENARVAILDQDEEAARDLAAALSPDGSRCIGRAVDVSVREAAFEAVAGVVGHFGQIDVLVNNAAIMGVVPMSRVGFESITEDDWDRMMSVNVKGTWFMCQAAVPHLRARGRGKIVNLGSTSALKGVKTQTHYIASKAALAGVTRCLARELGEDGITVNLVAPGSTLSEEDPDESVMALRNAGAQPRALSRVQYPADVVGAVIFLSSADSDFITGQTLVVDGGGVML